MSNKDPILIINTAIFMQKWDCFYSVYYCYYLIMFVYAFVKPMVCMRLNNTIIIIIIILTIIKAKVQNTELYITIIPSFQEPGFIFERVVSL
jgi:hypothetical protein